MQKKCLAHTIFGVAMAKRGRKPKEKKGYFYETEEQAIINYINSTNTAEREKLFNTILYPALTKMIESIIRRYKLYVPDEEFDSTFNDTISYLMTKLNNFRETIVSYDELEEKGQHNYEMMSYEEYKTKAKNAEESDPEFICVLTESNKWDEDPEVKYYQKVEHHYKAYSYCGTVCKNHLIYKNEQFTKAQERITSYDTVADYFENDIRYVADDPFSEDIAQQLIKDTSREVKKMISDPEKNALSENEIKVGVALIELFENWEEILYDDRFKKSEETIEKKNGIKKKSTKSDSNKLQKSTVLYFLREETRMSTKELRDNMKKYKCIYKLLRKAATE